MSKERLISAINKSISDHLRSNHLRSKCMYVYIYIYIYIYICMYKEFVDHSIKMENLTLKELKQLQKWEKIF